MIFHSKTSHLGGYDYMTDDTVMRNKQDIDDTTYQVLTMSEIKTLYKLYEFSYIPYENIEALEIVRKLSRLIDEHESKNR